MISHISHTMFSHCDMTVVSWWGYTLRHLCSRIYLIIASQTVVSLRCLCEVTLWDLCDLTYISYLHLKLWYHCDVPVRLHFETTVISHISNTVIFLWDHCELAVMSHSWLGIDNCLTWMYATRTQANELMGTLLFSYNSLSELLNVESIGTSSVCHRNTEDVPIEYCIWIARGIPGNTDPITYYNIFFRE